MRLLNRTPKLTPAEAAELRRIELAAQIEHERQVDQLRREQEAADRAEQRRAARDRAREEERRRKAKTKARARRRAQLHRIAEQARTVGPLLVVNAVTVGGQLAYVYDETPASWGVPARIAIAVGVATAAESVALYVGWHAHDALLQQAYTTAARLRRASYGIAAVMAAVNYSHFAGDGLEPTALAVILGVLSSLSPWLWGLHTRRAQHVQLRAENLVDEPGAQFGPARRRAFPIRSWAARRWSIDHNVRDPKEAWEGYRAHREAQRAAAPHGRIRAAWAALRGRTGEPTQAVSPDDPEIQQCAETREQMATARRRILGRTSWLGLGLWPRKAQRDEDPAADADAGQDDDESDPDPESETKSGPEPEPEGLLSRTDVRRLEEAYEELTRGGKPRPKGEVLGARAGCSKATANRWMRIHRPQAQDPGSDPAQK